MPKRNACMTKGMTKTCPCGRLGAKQQALTYVSCCGQYLDGELAAPDAESLMRSRYSAFVLENDGYLLSTWHASKRPATLDFEPNAKWLGLQVQSHMTIDDTRAEVTFVARQRDRTGRAIRLHERSRFVYENGCWYYVDGDSL
jgi:SEC-C motif domain protein